MFFLSVYFSAVHSVWLFVPGVFGPCMHLARFRFIRPSVYLVFLCLGIRLLCARLTVSF